MPTSATDFLAAERTFLAWIRTGLALMGLGFVVARFGLFLQAMQLGQPHAEIRSYGLSFWFGTALLLLGVFVNLAATWNHIRLVQDMDAGRRTYNRPSILAVALSVILALFGLAMAIYLVSVRQPVQTEKSMTSPANGILILPP